MKLAELKDSSPPHPKNKKEKKTPKTKLNHELLFQVFKFQHCVIHSMKLTFIILLQIWSRRIIFIVNNVWDYSIFGISKISQPFEQTIDFNQRLAQSSTFWFCALPSLLFSYLAGCNFRNSKPQSSDYFYFRPGSDACRAWYEVCCTCIFIRVLFPFIHGYI